MKEKTLFMLLLSLACTPHICQAQTAKDTFHSVFNLPDPPHVPDTLDIPTTKHGIAPIKVAGIVVNAVPITAKTTVKALDPWGRPVVLRSDTSTDAQIKTPARFWVVDSKVLPYGTTFQGFARPQYFPERKTFVSWFIMTIPSGRIILLKKRKPRANLNPSNPHTLERNR